MTIVNQSQSNTHVVVVVDVQHTLCYCCYCPTLIFFSLHLNRSQQIWNECSAQTRELTLSLVGGWSPVISPEQPVQHHKGVLLQTLRTIETEIEFIANWLLFFDKFRRFNPSDLILQREKFFVWLYIPYFGVPKVRARWSNYLIIFLFTVHHTTDHWY